VSSGEVDRGVVEPTATLDAQQHLTRDVEAAPDSERLLERALVRHAVQHARALPDVVLRRDPA